MGVKVYDPHKSWKSGTLYEIKIHAAVCGVRFVGGGLFVHFTAFFAFDAVSLMVQFGE
jgi:hypothetical protein